MAKANQMFINLPVADLARSKAYFEAMGFSINPQFSDDNAACVVLGENLFAMLLTHGYFKTFTPRAIADASATTEALVALALDSREEVDRIAEAALAAGGSAARPAQDHGFMFVRAIADPDGHIWELFWMNPDHIEAE